MPKKSVLHSVIRYSRSIRQYYSGLSTNDIALLKIRFRKFIRQSNQQPTTQTLAQWSPYFSKYCIDGTMSFHLDEAYASAIALNNIGVSLLQHHSFRPAMSAFNDALAVMRDLSRYAADESGKALHPRAMGAISTASEKLQRARKDLANSIVNLVDKTRTEIDFCILTESEAATVVGAALNNQKMFTKNTCFLIRIEHFDVDGLVELDLESSIILQNYGNVYRCLAFVSESNKARNQSESAFKLFNLAFSLLCGQCENEFNEDVPSTLLPISILILRSLIAFASLLEMTEQLQAFHSHMSDFQDLFLESEGFLVESQCITAAAA